MEHSLPTHPNFKNIIGDKFNRLTVVGYAGRWYCNTSNDSVWICRCECGNEVRVLRGNLRNGSTKSCGCLKAENRRRTKHGATVNGELTAEYRIWHAMKTRCKSKSPAIAAVYSRRGITVCDEWVNNFQAFVDHVGPIPSSVHTLDRIDNSKGYEPGNVRWATTKEQGRNKRSNRRFEIDGQIKCLIEWAEHFQVNYQLVSKRLQYGWDIRKALTTPLRARVGQRHQPPDT